MIQRANTKALENGVNVESILSMVREARTRGLKAPVLLMGYYNPLLAYGEERVLQDAKAAGANGFIMVDLPPEEAVRFRGHCTSYGLSYVPLIAPATSEGRMKLLCGIADSFLYVVSRQGVTGEKGTLNAKLPELLERVHRYSNGKPAAVGFGVSTREHFLSVGKIAEGVVIGSKIVSTLESAKEGEEARAVEEYCAQISGRRNGEANGTNGITREVGIIETMAEAKEPNGDAVHVDKVIKEEDQPKTNGHSKPGLVDQLEALNTSEKPDPEAIPSRFGEFGGQYVPESLMDCLRELEDGFNAARSDPAFWAEYRSYYPYMGRPGQLHEAERLTAHAGGAKVKVIGISSAV